MALDRDSSKTDGPVSPANGDVTSGGSAVPVTQMYMATKTAGVYTGLTAKQLEHLRVRGGGPVFCRIGRLVRYSRAALDTWMTARQYRSTSQQVRS